MKKVNIVCIRWKTRFSEVDYAPSDINKLYASIKRNTSYDVDFYCFTEQKEGLNPNIKAYDIHKMNIPEDVNIGCFMRACLYEPNLAGLAGQRVFYFDLDSLIVGNLDELFDYPQGDKFYIINDWRNRTGKKKDSIGQGSCFSFVVGTLSFIRDNFEKDYLNILKQYGTASQEYLSAQVIEKYGPLNFWPDNWFKSFRFHCMPHPLLRWFCTPKLPKVEGLKMISFHGLPNMQEAIDGVWSADPHHKKAPHGYKKLYKHVKPTKWILDYWKE